MKLAAIVNNRPIATACCSKILSAISSPCSPYDRIWRAASLPASEATGWSGYFVSQYGNRLRSSPVSDATLSASPTKPQLHAGIGLVVGEQPVHRDVDVPELAGHTGCTTNHVARFDDAPTEAGADDRRNGRATVSLGAEQLVVGVQRGGVAVVVVDDRQPEIAFDRHPEVETPPCLL